MASSAQTGKGSPCRAGSWGDSELNCRRFLKSIEVSLRQSLLAASFEAMGCIHKACRKEVRSPLSKKHQVNDSFLAQGRQLLADFWLDSVSILESHCT